MIDYPARDPTLRSLIRQVHDWLFSKHFLEPPTTAIYAGQEDRVRHCASMDGNAIWYSVRLGLQVDRTRDVVDRLIGWQWPDGGWNCDKRPAARQSSFHESFMGLRVLAEYGRRGNAAAAAAAGRAAEVFLQRRLFRRLRDGAVMDDRFLLLTYPNFYHYNILSALVIMAEAGRVRDPRCAEALDGLQSKQLPDGGFPLERRLTVTTSETRTHGTLADWGPGGKTRPNPFVTCEALYVLQEADRLGTPLDRG